ncbi:dihydrolipoamide acetyltransferase component (E2) of pyruvate dehydrogenase [Escherichia coli]|uniref:Dihydrolipoamide acetyltransferase component (E2) of pyruvate dehydrogenase n=1 Tax=Escherichia coli TaxID=562 RepID=A0A376W1K2_ECOLX|nr:dihydrolipoamide acetyltransferase component (E2) of pyruvate dehydrogenase [Escherichia coli]
MEVPAPFAGTVKEIKVNVGDKVSTGSLIMIFEVAVKQARQLRRLNRKRLRQRPLHQQLA